MRQPCSADWQSAVSPVGNRRTCRLPVGETAGCQPALRRGYWQGVHRRWLHSCLERQRVGRFALLINRTAQPRHLWCAHPHRAPPKAASGVIRRAWCPTRWTERAARRAWDAAISREDAVRRTWGGIRFRWGAARCTWIVNRRGFGGEVSCFWKTRCLILGHAW